MAKQKRQAVYIKDEEPVAIVINPFEVEQKIRKPLPPPTKLHKSKVKYSRKAKYPTDYNNQ